MIDRRRAIEAGSRVLAVGREVVGVFREREITFLAAAIAYYAFVSLLPALLLAVAVASAVGGEPLVERVLAVVDEFLTPAGRESLGTALTSARGRPPRRCSASACSSGAPSGSSGGSTWRFRGCTGRRPPSRSSSR